MEALGYLFFVGWLISVLVAPPVYLARAGLDWIHGLPSGFVSRNLGWFLVTVAKGMAWPAVFALWLFQGRPPSPWRVDSQGRVRRLPARS